MLRNKKKIYAKLAYTGVGQYNKSIYIYYIIIFGYIY